MTVLVVLPAYNEEQALPKTVAELQNLPEGFELLVVNDGSRDRTAEVAEGLAETSRVPLHVVHLPGNHGIGAAVQTGYRLAAITNKYDYVIQFDSDGQHDPTALVPMVEKCRIEGLDLCVGSRFLGSEGFRSTAARRLGIRFFAKLIGWLSRTPVTDPTSGLRCAGPRAWRRFADQYPDDFPEPESLYWCVRNGLKVGELPVVMRERQAGVSSIRTLGAAYYMLKVTLAILADRVRLPERVR